MQILYRDFNASGVIPVPTNPSDLGAKIIGWMAPIEKGNIMSILNHTFGDKSSCWLIGQRFFPD